MINPERGYVISGNHRAIASFYPAPMGVGTGGGGDTIRSWRLRERMEAMGQMTPEEFDRKVEALSGKYNDMVARLDGTYQLPEQTQ